MFCLRCAICASIIAYPGNGLCFVCKDVWKDLGGNGLRVKVVDPLFPAQWDQKPSKQPDLTVTFHVGAGQGRSPFPNIQVQKSQDIPLTLRLFQAVFADQDGDGKGVRLFCIRAFLLPCIFFQRCVIRLLAGRGLSSGMVVRIPSVSNSNSDGDQLFAVIGFGQVVVPPNQGQSATAVLARKLAFALRGHYVILAKVRVRCFKFLFTRKFACFCFCRYMARYLRSQNSTGPKHSIAGWAGATRFALCH